MDKREIILNTIIKEYIKNPTPISSKHLQSILTIQMSSATIRNYFKKMVEEGELEQYHISSGRVPAIKTLKIFWEKRLKYKNINIKNSRKIKESAKNYNIFCEYKFYEPNILKKIINFDDKYIVLEFEKSEFIIEFNEQLYKFFNQFVEVEAADLVSICKQIGLVALAKKLDIILNDDIVIEGLKELLEIVSNNKEWGSRNLKDFLDGTLLDSLNPGIYFEKIVPKGYLAYNSMAKIEQKDAKMLCVGALYRDYDNFFKNLTKEY